MTTPPPASLRPGAVAPDAEARAGEPGRLTDLPARTARDRVGVVALHAALSADGVTRPHRGAVVGARVTGPDGELLPAVTAVARGDGRYDVALSIVTLPVPLGEVADRVRDAVDRAAARADLGEALGRLDITFADVDEPAEAWA